ncbi:hypothetical protein ACA910_002264 [Epithemia clementina (nom. ined.)]
MVSEVNFAVLLRRWFWVIALVVVSTSIIVDDVAAVTTEGNIPQCKTVEVQQNFDLKTYISAPWFSQQQAETPYQTKEYFYCVRAQYEAVGGRTGKTKEGYTVFVNNQGQDANGVRIRAGEALCAFQPAPEEEPAKLGVAPCHLPPLYAGPYWVVAYEDGPHGYSLVSGGPPIVPALDGSGGCHTADRKGFSGGLWILTRSAQRNETVVEEVRAIAQEKGFDLSVLHDVNQENCEY